MALYEIDARSRDLGYAALDYITAHPETGFKEKETSAYMRSRFEELGFTVKSAGDIPGFVCDMDFSYPGPRIALIAELDALYLPAHPCADALTGAAHACGHNAQCAAVLAAASVLQGMAEGLSGSVRFVIVPAEELIEFKFRKELMQQGVIRCPGGKPEFIRRGLFDGVDAAILVHTYTFPDRHAVIIKGCNGCLMKAPVFTGLASHAGGAPEKGINALGAAMLGLNAVNALRETFRDDEHIRVHGIITQGGSSPNITPDRIALEAYVRAANTATIARVNARVNRALAGSAAALGAGLSVCDTMGYLPLTNDVLIAKAMESTQAQLGIPVSSADIWDTGCTDMGDLSHLMPTVQVVISGAEGTAHSVDYRIADREAAVVKSALLQALTVRALLCDGAAKLNEAIAAYKPAFETKQAYLAMLDSLSDTYEAVEHMPNGDIHMNIHGGLI